MKDCDADVMSIFGEALELAAPQARDAYLTRACADDAFLRDRVSALLRAHEKVGGFLGGRSPDPSPPTVPSDTPAPDGPARSVGRYKLLQHIGEGGFGTVYLAEQSHPVRRMVALKIVKPGMDTRQVIARFEAERQALALMDHPNIARVLDAGATDAGHPYFVMELIRGVPITKYCDERHLTPRDRLGLFLQVCAAVQHAHQKGIIHRDLKPSNVLVAMYDGNPVPKVIDFGVAKATGGRLTDRTLFTGFGAMVGTLEYMSPEQAELNQLDVDTRSDVYSLGVLLYELLTGTTPLEGKRLKEAALLEALRVIREEEPAKPSTRLSTTEGLPAIALSRGMAPKALNGLVRGELDWIVMKCLDKDRNRRYATVNALALDVDRYMRDEPVQACPPTVVYRFRKFARRHRSTMATAALLGLTLVLAVGATAGSIGWAARDRAARRVVLEREGAKALEEAETWRARDNLPEALAAVRRAEALLSTGGVGEELRRRARRWRTDLDMVERLEEIRLQQADLEGDRFQYTQTGPAYAAAFRDYGVDVAAGDVAAQAGRIRDSAIREQLAAALDDWSWVKPAKDAAGREQLRALARLADPDEWRNRFRDPALSKNRKALEELAERPEVSSLPPSTAVLLGRALGDVDATLKAIAVLRRALNSHPGDFWLNHETAAMYMRVAKSGQSDTAAVREAIGFLRAALAVRPHSPPAFVNLGWWLSYEGNYEEAALAHRQAIRLQPDYFPAHASLGMTLSAARAYDESIPALLRAVELRPDDYWANTNLANAYWNKGDRDAAIPVYRRAVRLRPRMWQARIELGRVYHEQKRWEESAAELREVTRLKPDDHDAFSYLAIALGHQGLVTEALEAARAAVRLAPTNGLAHDSLGFALVKKGRFDEAVAEFREAVRLTPADARFHNDLGAVLWTRGKLDESIAECRESIRLSPRFAWPQFNLGVALEMRGELDEAIAAFRAASALDPADPSPRYRLGLALWQKGEPGGAIEPFRDAIAAYSAAVDHSPDARALNNLAWALATCPHAQFRDGARAVGLARRAVELTPDDGNYWNTLGAAHCCAGQWEEAAAALEKSMQLRAGGNGHDWFFTAMADQHRGDAGRARSWYDRAVDWMKKNRPADLELKCFRREAAATLGIDAGKD